MQIAGDNLYEKTVVPMIKELNVEMPVAKNALEILPT